MSDALKAYVTKHYRRFIHTAKEVIHIEGDLVKFHHMLKKVNCFDCIWLVCLPVSALITACACCVVVMRQMSVNLSQDIELGFEDEK